MLNIVYKCTQDDVTPCDLGARNSFTFIPGLATRNAINGTTLLDLGNADLNVTATLAVNFDDATLIYIAFSNISGNYLSKVCICVF